MSVEINLEGMELWYLQGVGINNGKVVLLLPNGVAVPLEQSEMQMIGTAYQEVRDIPAGQRPGCNNCGPTGWKPTPYTAREE